MTPDPPEDTRGGPRLFAAGKKGIRLAVAVLWARALLGATAAVTVGGLVDAMADGGAPSRWVGLLAATLGARALLSSSSPALAAGVTASLEQDLRHRVLQVVVSLPPSQERRTGDLVGKATEGIGSVAALGAVFLPQLVGGMTIPLLIVAVVASIDWVTAVVLLAAIPLVPLLLRILESRFASVSDRYRETADQLAARFLDAIQGLSTLKAMNRAKALGDRLEVESERLRAETMRLLRVNQLALLAVDTLFTLGTVVAAAGMAGLRLGAGAITVGEAVAVVLLGVTLIEPLTQIGRFFYVGAIGRAAAKQVRRLLAMQPVEAAGPTKAELRGAVELAGVGFSYPDGTSALDGVTLSIAPGERVALVGPSGAGKTTLAHLVLGLLQPTSGTVAVGGRAVLVPQRPYLFSGTVRENLQLAKPTASDEELWAALEAAELADVVRARDPGLEVQVGERGLRWSGGEVQRLAIARALLVDAPVVVLDEPTSNVDLDTESRLRAAWDRLGRDRTMLVIAHRRSTIAGMDRVVRLGAGRLVEPAAGESMR